MIGQMTARGVLTVVRRAEMSTDGDREGVSAQNAVNSATNGMTGLGTVRSVQHAKGHVMDVMTGRRIARSAQTAERHVQMVTNGAVASV